MNVTAAEAEKFQALITEFQGRFPQGRVVTELCGFLRSQCSAPASAEPEDKPKRKKRLLGGDSE